MLPLPSVLFCISKIVIDNETVITSNILGSYLALCGTIIYILNWSSRSTLTKELFLVIIESLILCRNGHENMVLHETPYPKKRETVTGCPFTTKDFLGNYCSNIYPYFYLFTLFYSIYSTYIEWIHVVQILQIRKFQHQVRIALYYWMVVIQIVQIQPGSCIVQSKNFGWYWSPSYWEVQMWKLLVHLHHHIWSAYICLKFWVCITL